MDLSASTVSKIVAEVSPDSTYLVNEEIPPDCVEKDWKIFADLRKQSREKNPGPREDDFLDDEQWYCENEAEWGEKVEVPAETVRDPSKLLEFIKSQWKDCDLPS